MMTSSESMETPVFGMMTIFDEIAESHPIPIDLTSGTHESFVVYDGVSRGISVLARCTWHKALLGFKVDSHQGDISVTVNITLDDVAHNWWGRKYQDLEEIDSRRVRHILIRAQGDVVGGFTVGGEAQKIKHTFVIAGDRVKPGGLLMLELLPFGGEEFEGPVNVQPLLGLQLDSINILPATSAPSAQTYVDVARHDLASTTQGSITTQGEPVKIQFRIAEQPPLAPSLQSFPFSKTLKRGIRKAGVVRRSALRRSGRLLRDAKFVHRAFRVDALRQDHSSVDVDIELLGDDILELTFPADKSGRQLLFFELGVRQQHLAEVGYASRIVLSRVDADHTF